MSFPIFPSERNFETLKHLRRSVSDYLTDDRAELRAYAGVFHGLNEVVRALYRTFPHRSEMMYFKGLSPYISPLVRLASKEGMSLKPFTKADIKDVAKTKETMSSDVLMTLIAEDDPLTGEVYGIDSLLEELSQNKIFGLVVSHRKKILSQNLNPSSPFTSSFLPISENFALGVMGARTKVDDLIYGGVALPKNAPELTHQTFEQTKEDKDKVLKFEEEFQSYKFFKSEERLFDRAVLAIPDVDGSAVASFLDSDFNYKGIVSGSACEWNDDKYMNWLVEAGYETSLTRGLVVFPLSGLDEKLPEALKATLDKIRKLQGE